VQAPEVQEAVLHGMALHSLLDVHVWQSGIGAYVHAPELQTAVSQANASQSLGAEHI
jgi:hypothetical protein